MTQEEWEQAVAHWTQVYNACHTLRASQTLSVGTNLRGSFRELTPQQWQPIEEALAALKPAKPAAAPEKPAPKAPPAPANETTTRGKAIPKPARKRP